jgi:hypothetical protein
MFKCDECSKEFANQRALNAHQVAHKKGDRYSVSRKKEINTFICLNCGTETEWNHSTYNKFCSNACNGEYQRKTANEQIEAGVVLGFAAMRRYLLETRGCCEECGIIDTYNGKPITLQCDHIDGDNDNHSLNNLRLLCPNCHSQTETWCGRNKKDTKRNNYLREYKAGLAQR